MEKTEFHIGKVLVKCAYTITEKGKDPEAMDQTVFNISYTHYQEGIPNGPFRIKIFEKEGDVKIGQRLDFDSKDQTMLDFKVAFLDSRKKTLRMKFYDENQDIVKSFGLTMLATHH
jgi:hypothetical protein